jgi:hypothetical protein
LGFRAASKPRKAQYGAVTPRMPGRLSRLVATVIASGKDGHVVVA